MPFNLLLFIVGLATLAKPDIRTIACTGCIAIPLSVLSKPNYLMAFGPCYAIALVAVLARNYRAGHLSIAAIGIRLLLAFGPLLPLIAWQYVAVGAETGDLSKITVRPLEIWAGFLDPPPLGQPFRYRPEVVLVRFPMAILLGIAFPLVATLLYPRQAVRRLPLGLAWATLVVAIAQFALISASYSGTEATGWGMRLIDQVGCGIFQWGMVFANQVLFVVACDFVLQQSADWRRWAAFGVLTLHGASGVFFLARCLYIPSLVGIF
jgi:hypothetical protein